MTEAFEIGVTLALSDGVSAGIAQARKDMAQLEHVLQAGGVSVQQLRAAATAALAVGQPVPSGELSRSRPEKMAAAPGDGQEALPVAQAAFVQQPQAQDGALRETPTVFVAAPQTAPSRPVTPQEARGAATPVASAPLRTGLADAAASATVTVLSGLGAPDSPAGSAGFPPAESQSPINVSMPVSVTEAGFGRQAVDTRDARRPGWRDTAASPAGISAGGGPVAGFARSVPREAKAGVAAAPSAAMERSVAWTFTAPSAMERQSAIPPAAAPDFGVFVGAAPNQEARGLSPSSAPSVPPAAATSSGPTEGDVFLDGKLVGRWMSRFLAQEAGRAASGPTGFDPRRGRLLPGATVGG